MSSVPQGPRYPSTTRYLYVSRSNFEKYKENQKKQEATINSLEKDFSYVAESYKNLRIAHEKMVRREKKRDDLFDKIKKGVKGL